MLEGVRTGRGGPLSRTACPERCWRHLAERLEPYPRDVSEITKEQTDFLKQSVAGLAEEGKVICVRLALFAEMMKGKEWTPATLKEVGGTSGIGVTFLEETFSSTSASPKHQASTRKRLVRSSKPCCPNPAQTSKATCGLTPSCWKLSGYGNRPKDFDDLIQILDSEIRLITPTDPEGKDARRCSRSRRPKQARSTFS